MQTPQTYLTPPPAPLFVVKDKWMPGEVEEALKYNPKTHLGKAIVQTQKALTARYGKSDPDIYSMFAEVIDRLASCVIMESNLHLYVMRGQHSLENYRDRRPLEDYGWTGYKVITTAGVQFMTDAWQNSVELEVLKFHGIGTGSTAEASSDTALVTELTSEYNPDNTRATGTLTEGASANIFRTVGTNTLDGTPGASLREHGVFSAATAGTLWDRTVYAAITLSSGDSLQSTYDCTISAGG